jgi:hypothetical protein
VKTKQKHEHHKNAGLMLRLSQAWPMGPLSSSKVSSSSLFWDSLGSKLELRGSCGEEARDIDQSSDSLTCEANPM